jgi:dTDP-glucose 4,6-dehydratase
MILDVDADTRVLVSGSSGFVGGALAPQLADLGFSVTCLERYVSNRYNVPTHKKLKTVFADLNDHYAIQQLIRQIQPEYVIHLAALSPVSASYDRWQEYLTTNFEATVNLAESCMRDNHNLRQFMFAGTSECYGNQKDFPIPETASYYPNSPYSCSKVAAVEYLRYMWDAYRFPVTIIFPFNSYGRAECKHFVTEKIIWQMLTKDKILLGDPEPTRDLMFISDHCDGYLAALGNEKALGETFNICTGTGVTVRELVTNITKITGFKGEVVWGTIPARPLDVQCLIGDNTKARNVLGWTPKIKLDDGLRRTVELLKKEVKPEIVVIPYPDSGIQTDRVN